MKIFLSKLVDQLGKKFIDIIALIIALVAVNQTFIQSENQKEYEISNRQPFLQIEFERVDDNEMKGLKLYNVGYGPAIIKTFKIFLNQSDFESDEYYSKWLPAVDSLLNFRFEKINYLTEGYLIADSEIYLLGTTATDVMNAKDIPGSFYNSLTAQEISKIIIVIEYTSLNPLDDYVYTLRFNEKLKPTNHRMQRKEVD